MAIYEITAEHMTLVPATTFSAAGVQERADLQRLLRTQIQIVSPDTLVISEEFSEWEDSKRRIDLLGVDKDANLVVIELKRTEDGGHMELQALRYAAMVSTMTFDKTATVYASFLRRLGSDLNARDSLLKFLEWDEPDDQAFAQDVRIVLAGADFSKELTTTVLWLNQRMMDIRCVRLKPYVLDGRLLVDAQQVIPIPEAAEYQVKLRDKEQRERASAGEQWDAKSFLEAIRANKGESAATVAQDLLAWLTPKVSRLWWGKGKGGVVPIIDGDIKYHVFQMTSIGAINFYFDLLGQRPQFSDISTRRDYLVRLDSPVGTVTGPERLDGRPSISLEKLTETGALQRFKDAVTWFLAQVPSPITEDS